MANLQVIKMNKAEGGAKERSGIALTGINKGQSSQEP